MRSPPHQTISKRACCLFFTGSKPLGSLYLNIYLTIRAQFRQRRACAKKSLILRRYCDSESVFCVLQGSDRRNCGALSNAF